MAVRLLAALMALAVPAQGAEPAPFTEYEVKAGFIYNFAKLVEWPETAAGSVALRMCIVGDDPFGVAKEAMVGRTVDRRRIEVLALPPRADLRSCHIAFLPGSLAAELRPLLERLRGLPVLTVGDTAGYAARGVIINFYREQDSVRFEINLDAARRARLQISSRLLNLARIARDAGDAR